MNITGIITEYNPFHNGHLLHINESKKITNADFIIAVMSGNFVQRGEPAIVDKYTRTKMALLNGVDMVIELPVYFATASAEFFAKAAVRLLMDTNIVSNICFGSESGHLASLSSAAKLLNDESPIFKQALKKALDNGLSYPAAREIAFQAEQIDISLQTPNDILGVEYLKALLHFKSDMQPYTIHRSGAGYHDKTKNHSIASATGIRHMLLEEKSNDWEPYMPQSAVGLLRKEFSQNKGPHTFESLSPFLHYALATSTPISLQKIVGMNEGLENRILASSQEEYSIQKIAKIMKTKRYTLTKIHRLLLHTILTIKKENFNYFQENGFSQYIRVLGVRKESKPLLSMLYKNSSIPVFTGVMEAKRTLSPSGCVMLEKELEATAIYWAALRQRGCSAYSEYREPFIVL